IVVDPVVDEGLSVRGGGDAGEKGDVVDVDAGERHRVDLVDRRLEFGGVDGQVHQPGAPVVGHVLGAAVVVQSHLLEHGQLDLEELDGGAPDGELGLGEHGRGEQAHRLHRVLGGRVVDLLVDVGAAVHGQGGGADALDPD